MRTMSTNKTAHANQCGRGKKRERLAQACPRSLNDDDDNDDDEEKEEKEIEKGKSRRASALDTVIEIGSQKMAGMRRSGDRVRAIIKTSKV